MTVEFADKIRQYLQDNLRIEMRKDNEYCNGGEYRPMYSVVLFLGDVEISSSSAD